MDQSENDIREIGRRRELPPDEPYGAGDEAEPEEHDCEAATRVVHVYRERREVCCTCGRVLRTVITP